MLQKYHCSTSYAYWLDLSGQSLPSLAQQIDVQACAHSPSNGPCCHYDMGTMKIRNCGAYYIYYLQPYDGCEEAFCLDG